MSASSSAPRSSPHFVVASLPLHERDRVGVVQPREGRHDAAQLLDVALELRQLGGAALEHALHEIGDEILLQAHVVVRVVPRHLRLDHPELGEVAARLRLLGAEGGAEV